MSMNELNTTAALRWAVFVLEQYLKWERLAIHRRQAKG